MIKHTELGLKPFQRSRQLKLLIADQQITMAGNLKLKIYGSLRCSSGKRMKAENRIFFSSENEATQCGYRPCGHCMRGAYKKWKETKLCRSSGMIPKVN
jgi:methylphosphotriester-DNA--protein-cysteine methyltransferase